MTEHPISEGSMVRLTADTPDDWVERHTKGETFVVNAFIPALKPGDEGYDEPDDFIQVPFYYCNSKHGISDVMVPADIVEVVFTADEMDNRRLPTRTDIARALQSSSMSLMNEGFEINETDGTPEGGDSFEAFGETDEGLSFGIKVKVERVWRTDF